MKLKRTISAMLAGIMLAGVLPMPAVAAETGFPKDGVTVEGNTYTDTAAEPFKQYEYTITGSDGSVQLATVGEKKANTAAVDLTKLDAALAKAADKQSTEYTAESWKAFAEKREAARTKRSALAVKTYPDAAAAAADQTAANDAAAALTAAMNALQPILALNAVRNKAGTSVTLTWAAKKGASYEVKRSDKTTALATVNTGTYTDSTVLKDRAYTYTVQEAGGAAATAAVPAVGKNTGNTVEQANEYTRVKNPRNTTSGTHLLVIQDGQGENKDYAVSHDGTATAVKPIKDKLYAPDSFAWKVTEMQVRPTRKGFSFKAGNKALTARHENGIYTIAVDEAAANASDGWVHEFSGSGNKTLMRLYRSFEIRVDWAYITIDNGQVIAQYDENSSDYCYLYKKSGGAAKYNVNPAGLEALLAYQPDPNQFTAESIKTYNAVKAGKDQVAAAAKNGNPYADQTAAQQKLDTVNKAYTELLAARDTLVYQVDTTALEAVLTEAVGKQQQEYTTDSWKTFAAAKEQAQKLLDTVKQNKNTYTYANQASADQAKADMRAKTSALESAMRALAYKVDTSALETALQECLAAQKKEEYTPTSWTAYETAKNEADALVQTVKTAAYTNPAEAELAREQLALAEEKLRNAWSGLEFLVALQPLRDELAKAKNTENIGYTTESWLTLQTRIVKAEEVLKAQENQHYKDFEQAKTARTAVKQAQDELTKALTGLQEAAALDLKGVRDPKTPTTVTLTWTTQNNVTYTVLRDGTELKKDLRSGTFTDTAAQQYATHTYEVRGSDGAYQSVKVLAQADSGSNTGNKVEEKSTDGSTVYERVTDPKTAAGGGYLLVYVDSKGTPQAVVNKLGLAQEVTHQPVAFEHAGDRTTILQPADSPIDWNTLKWTVTNKTDAGKIKFETIGADGKTASLTAKQIQGGSFFSYTYEYLADISSVINKDTNDLESWQLDNVTTAEGGMTLSRKYWEDGGLFGTSQYAIKSFYVNETTNKLGGGAQATPLYLYQKKVVPGETFYTVNDAGLAALLKKAEGMKAENYAQDEVWTAFVEAKKAAEKAKNGLQPSYTDKGAADQALADIDEAHRNLQIAMDALSGLQADTTELADVVNSAHEQIDQFPERYQKDVKWENYLTEKENAEATLKKYQNFVFKTPAEQKKAQQVIDKAAKDLRIAINNLNPVENVPITVPISWLRRTEEPVHSTTGVGQLVTNIHQFPKNQDGTNDYSRLTLGERWDELMKMSATIDKEERVWDYGTPNQYANVTKIDGVKAATWNDRTPQGQVDTAGNAWLTSSARKFYGTFVWPVGFDLKGGKLQLSSLNDTRYAPIYEHVHAHPELDARYGESKVLPVNDDMFVFIYEDADRPDNNPQNWATKDDILKHMVFWTGSSGKGRWSMPGADADKKDDQARKTPADFYGTPALPSFNGVYPNLVADDPNLDSTGKLVTFDSRALMPHSDGWYAMVNQNSITSTLDKLYPDGLEGKTMHLLMLCLDNSTAGGMDKWELKMSQPERGTVPVTVEYYIGDLSAENKPFATATLGNYKPGDLIELSKGTADGDLNYKRQEAATRTGKSVSMGRQMGTVPYRVRPASGVEDQNTIRVVYSVQNPGTQYFTYDFGVTNFYQYRIPDASLSQTTILDEQGKPAAIPGLKVDTTQDTFVISFEPQSSEGTPVKFTLAAKDGEAPIGYDVQLVPASNTLYEENFFTVKERAGRAGWTNEGAHQSYVVYDNGNAVASPDSGIMKASVADANDSPYGYTEAYKSCTGVNGSLKTTMAAGQLSKPLEFTFLGRAFDLIGSCGPDSGMLLVKLFRTSTGNDMLLKSYLVDTRYVDEKNPGQVLHQVPLIHVDAGGGGGYRAVVTGSHIPDEPAGPNLASVGSSFEENVYAFLREEGLTEKQIENTEFIRFSEELQSGTGTQLMSTGAPVKTLELDGFRVYRKSKGNAAAYPADELDRTYINIQDAVKDQFAAFVEPKKDAGTGEMKYTIAEYRKAGGPAGEIYLAANQSISFNLTEASAQISARAVTGKTQMSYSVNGSKEQAVDIGHNTEMYYKISNETGVRAGKYQYTIKNTGTELLAVSMIKTADTALAPMTRADQQQAVLASAFMGTTLPEIPDGPRPSDGFEPQSMDIRLNTLDAFDGQLASLVVTTSTDVAALRVNGQTLLPGNGVLVKSGLEEQYVFAMTETIEPGRKVYYQVQAFDENGLAGAVHTVPEAEKGTEE